MGRRQIIFPPFFFFFSFRVVKYTRQQYTAIPTIHVCSSAQAAIAYNNHHPHNNIQVDVINIYIDEARGWPGLGSWAPLFPVVLKYIQQQQQQQPASPYIIILMIHPSPFTITPAWPTMSENQTTPPPLRSISCCAISIRFESTLIYTRFAPDKIHNTHPE